MITTFAAEAVEFEKAVLDALSSTGGIEHARRAEVDSSYRELMGDLLAELGTWEIDPTDDDQLEAAALACRAAGRLALPYPVAERLAINGIGTAAAVVAGETARVAHADLDLQWTVFDVAGKSAPLIEAGDGVGGKLGRFVYPVQMGRWSENATGAPLVLVLQTWMLLGMLQAAQQLTCTHVRDRHQFGQALAEFQGVKFALTDIAVATQGLEEVAKYTLWSVTKRDRGEALTDALALRAVALEAAETTFRIAHQLHGANGFCDETALSWLSRYSQPLRRLPLGRSQTQRLLTRSIEANGFYSPLTNGART